MLARRDNLKLWGSLMFPCHEPLDRGFIGAVDAHAGMRERRKAGVRDRTATHRAITHKTIMGEFPWEVKRYRKARQDLYSKRLDLRCCIVNHLTITEDTTYGRHEFRYK